jgi:hypothetical protein
VAGVPSGEESSSMALRKVPEMFPLSDPSVQLDIHRQRVAELIREAGEHSLARTAASAGRHRRFRRRPVATP